MWFWTASTSSPSARESFGDLCIGGPGKICKMYSEVQEAVRGFSFARRALRLWPKEPDLTRLDFMTAGIGNLSTLTNRKGTEYVPVTK